MTSNKYVIKTDEGLKVLTINDVKSNQYSLQHLLGNNDYPNYTDSLGILASDSQIIIAAVQDVKVDEKFKSSIQLMKKPIAEIWEEGAYHRDPSVATFLC